MINVWNKTFKTTNQLDDFYGLNEFMLEREHETFSYENSFSVTWLENKEFATSILHRQESSLR